MRQTATEKEAGLEMYQKNVWRFWGLLQSLCQSHLWKKAMTGADVQSLFHRCQAGADEVPKFHWMTTSLVSVALLVHWARCLEPGLLERMAALEEAPVDSVETDGLTENGLWGGSPAWVEALDYMLVVVV